MKKTICAVLVMAILSIPCFPQGTTIDDALAGFKPLEYIKRKKIDDLTRQAKEKNAVQENSPLANRATGFSLFFRLVGENRNAESLKWAKQRLSNIGITGAVEQNFVIERAKEFVLYSWQNKVEAEKTVKKYHIPGSRHHNQFSDKDSKIVKELLKDKGKALKKIVHDLRGGISEASFSNIENYIALQINPNTKFDLTEEGAAFLENYPQTNNRQVTESEEYPPDYPDSHYYDGFLYQDFDGDPSAPSRSDNYEVDGYPILNYVNMVAEAVYEVNPASNSHGIDLWTRIVNAQNDQVLTSNYTVFFWTETANPAYGTNSFSLENYFSVYPDSGSDLWEGPYFQQARFNTVCGAGFDFPTRQDRFFGWSNVKFRWAGWKKAPDTWVFVHDDNHGVTVNCPTRCGIDYPNTIDVRLVSKDYPIPPDDEMVPAKLRMAIPFVNNNWCINRLAGAVGANFFGHSWTGLTACYDTIFRQPSIFN